jgi:hypothetical protein
MNEPNRRKTYRALTELRLIVQDPEPRKDFELTFYGTLFFLIGAGAAAILATDHSALLTPVPVLVVGGIGYGIYAHIQAAIMRYRRKKAVDEIVDLECLYDEIDLKDDQEGTA